MKPRNLLAESMTPDGAPMSLYEHDGAYSISFQGQELMHSKASASELLLGKLGIELVRKEPSARVMIGGLGLGFTLRTVLEDEYSPKLWPAAAAGLQSCKEQKTLNSATLAVNSAG